MYSLGAEAQAVGRVHRIGQSKQTFVYRFFIQGTVESKIYEHVYQKVHPRHDHTTRPTTRHDQRPNTYLIVTLSLPLHNTIEKGQATGHVSAN
jgi:hypothetical protein